MYIQSIDNKIMERIRKFDWEDICIWKLCVLFLGILLGLKIKKNNRKTHIFLWIGFIATLVTILFRLITITDEELWNDQHRFLHTSEKES